MNNQEVKTRCEGATSGFQSEIVETLDIGRQFQKEDTRVDIGGSSMLTKPDPSLGPLLNAAQDQISCDDKRRAEYLMIGVPLYQAAMKGDWKSAKILIDKHEDIVIATITNNLEIALHIAVAAKHKGFVRNLLKRMKSHDLSLQNKDGNTALCFAAASGVVDIAEMLINMNPSLAMIRGGGGMTPIHVAALFGQEEMVTYLFSKTNFSNLTQKEFINLFLAVISADIYDVALRMLKGKEELAISRNDIGETALHLMARKPSSISRRKQLNLFERSANSLILIRSYPDLIWKVDEKSRSLFHARVFDIIYELGAIKDLIAAYNKMQRELLLFKAVKTIVPCSYVKAKNSDGEVAHDIFTREHKNLRKEGEKWMKKTATSCMLVATLIATVVFAAAFTIPGGNDDMTCGNDHEAKGFSNFRNKLWFDIFILSDSVALFSSVISIVIFLSILTSRYAEDDFQTALPSRLVLGLLALFVSIISMVLAFTATMILIRYQEPKWSLILIICLASLTALSFITLHIHLWFDTFRSCLFKLLVLRRKSVLYP